MNDVLVLGGGPAGAACALWSQQLGMRVMLLERDSAVGGLQKRSPYTNRWLPALPGKTGQQIAARLHAQLSSAEVPYRLGFDALAIRHDAGLGGWCVSSATGSLYARYIVIATGSLPRRSGFTESDCIGIGPGTSMERIAMRGRRVAILGGGDNAFDQAKFANFRGALSVNVFCRNAPRAQPVLQQEIPRARVHIGPFEVDTSRMTVNHTHYDVIGVQYGFEASIPAGLQLPLRDGYIDVERSGAVRGHDSLFAAGEVTNYWHPCVATAFAHGAQVAKSIQCKHLGACSASSRSSVGHVLAAPMLETTASSL
jgi:thioredoxin reductase